MHVLGTSQWFKKQSHYFADKGLSNRSYSFSSSHIQVWELGHKEGWTLENCCFWTMVLEKTLESHLDCKEIKPVNPKEIQPWIFIGRTDAEAEAPIFWPPVVKNWFFGKNPDAGKDWRREEKGITEDEMVGWHHWLKGHEFEQALGNGEGQGNLACCSLWGLKKLDTSEVLNNNRWYKCALKMESHGIKPTGRHINDFNLNIINYHVKTIIISHHYHNKLPQQGGLKQKKNHL